MSAIGPTSPLSAAGIRAAALAAVDHERPTSLEERYAGDLTDGLPTLKQGNSLTITNTRNGTTIDGKSIADWVAGLASDTNMYYPPATASPAKANPADTIVLSPQAAALIEREKIALAVMRKGDPATEASKVDRAKTEPQQTMSATPTAAASTTATGHIFHTADEFQAAMRRRQPTGLRAGSTRELTSTTSRQ